jgi:hypothetical protein
MFPTRLSESSTDVNRGTQWQRVKKTAWRPRGGRTEVWLANDAPHDRQHRREAVGDRAVHLRSERFDVVSRRPHGSDDRHADRERAREPSAPFVLPRDPSIHRFILPMLDKKGGAEMRVIHGSVGQITVGIFTFSRVAGTSLAVSFTSSSEAVGAPVTVSFG